MTTAQVKANERFGQITVESVQSGTETRINPVYTCKCDCGNTLLVTHVALIRNRVETCGNCKRRSNRIHTLKPSEVKDRLLSTYTSKLKRVSKKFNLPYTLPDKYIWFVIRHWKCEECGVKRGETTKLYLEDDQEYEMTHNRVALLKFYKGFVSGNIKVVCKECYLDMLEKERAK